MAMHAVFDRIPAHGELRCLAQSARLCGVDHIHTGTAGLGRLESEDTMGINEWLYGDCHGLTDVLPMASGGLHHGVVAELVDALGTNIVIQADGGVQRHPGGTGASARALRAAAEAATAGESLESPAKHSPALATALDK
jgi:ribulose-bisphosphate carboxylase large chain